MTVCRFKGGLARKRGGVFDRGLIPHAHNGSILGPLLFLIYINDLPDNLQSTAKLFADNTL